MKRLIIAAMVSFSLMLQLQVDALAGDNSTHKWVNTEKYQTPLPVPGYRSGMPNMVSEGDLKKQATSDYPAWFRGTGKGSSYKKDSTYFWTMAVGPKNWVDTGLDAQHFAMGTMTFKPGAKYPIHSHAAWEVYYVLEGEGTITKYDKAYKVKPGDFFINRPYDVHSISNDSDTRPLKVIWAWWTEGGDGLTYFKGGIPVLPDECWKDKKTACMSMKPPRILKGSDRYAFMRDLEPKK